MLPFGIHETCPYSFTHGEYACASNMDSIKILSTQVGGKLMNLYGAFECAFHIFACMAQVLNFKIHACVVYASYMFEW